VAREAKRGKNPEFSQRTDVGIQRKNVNRCTRQERDLGHNGVGRNENCEELKESNVLVAPSAEHISSNDI